MTLRNTCWRLAPVGLTALLALTACGGSSGAPASAPSGTSSGAAANTIVIQSFMFHPASLTVAPGTTVKVRNADSVTHTLTDKADPGLFSSGDVGPGQTKTFKAPGKAGSYPYICMIHQYMSGTLVVS